MADNIKRDKEKPQQIQVFLRLRPLNKQERENRSFSCIDVNSRELFVKQHHGKRYCFDGVFNPNIKQLVIYETVVKPLIPEILAGYNCTVFAYGQTGTGKTYTMVGGPACCSNVSWQDDEQAGVIPRVLAQLFDELRLLQQEHTVRVSYLELYNEELYDLLADGVYNNRIRLFEDQRQKSSVIIQGLEEQIVRNKYEVYKILEKGEEKRRTAVTLTNDHSSRSHTVFCITVHIRETTIEGEELMKTGKLNLVDLAGSENISRSGAIDRRAREAGSINQSLLNLGRVIKALVEKSVYIPYRASKLTRILQDSLGGRTKTSIIATISPSSACLDETLSTLDYANRARYIINRPEVNQRMTQKTVLSQCLEEIERLRKDLSAARTGHGICLDSENYNRLIADQQMYNEELAEKAVIINDLEEQVKYIQGQKKAAEENLSQLNSSFEKIQSELVFCRKMLLQSIQEKDEYHHLAECYAKDVKLLHEQARVLLNVSHTSIDNEKMLRNKFDSLYSSAAENNKIVLQMKNKIDCLCGDMMKEMTGFMECYTNRNSVLNNTVQNLQEIQKQNYEEAISFINSTQDELKVVLTECRNKITSRHEDVEKWANKFMNEYENYVQIIDNIFKSNSMKLSQNVEQILNSENQLHEEFYNKMEEKFKEMAIATKNLSDNVSLNFDSLKEELLVELGKLIENLTNRYEFTEDIMTHAFKWREELRCLLDYGFEVLENKLQKSKDLDKENLLCVDNTKDKIKSLISDVNQKVQSSIIDSAGTITEMKNVVQKNTCCRYEFQNQVLNELGTNKQEIQQNITQQLEQLYKFIEECSVDFAKENFQNLINIHTELDDAQTNIDEITNQQSSINTDSFLDTKSKSNKILKELTNCKTDVIKHNMSLSSKLNSVLENATNFVNNDIIEIKHNGDTPVRSQYSYQLNLKQPESEEDILLKYRQQQPKRKFSTDGKTSPLSLNDENYQENFSQHLCASFEDLKNKSSTSYEDCVSVLKLSNNNNSF